MKKHLIVYCCLFLLTAVIVSFAYHSCTRFNQRISHFSKQLSKDNMGNSFWKGEFFIATGLKEQPQVKVEFLIPCDKNGIISKSANDVVFYAPGSNCRDTLTRSVIQAYPKDGLSLFTIEITSDMQYYHDPVKSYERISSGWHTVIFRAYQLLCKEFSLSPQKLLLAGESSGGNMAQGLAATFPDQFDAVAFVGANRLYCHAPNQDIPWLIINTWLCFGTDSSNRFAKELQEKELNVLRTFTVPDWNCPNIALYFHTPSLEAYDLIRIYLVEIAKLRRQNNGIVPPKKCWPIQRQLAEDEVLILPSENFAKSWDNLSLFLPQKSSNNLKQAIRLAAIRDFDDPPAEEVVFLQNYEDDPFLWLNSIYYLQAMGYNITTYYSIPSDWLSLPPFDKSKDISIIFSGENGSQELARLPPDLNVCKKIFAFNPEFNAFKKNFMARKKCLTPIPLITMGANGYLPESEESTPEMNLIVLPVENDFLFPKKSYDTIFPRLSSIHRIW